MEIVLSRIILFTQDVDRLKNFYQQHFNFSQVEEVEHEWVVLQAGKMEIAFHKIGHAYETGKPFKAANNSKLVFDINTRLRVFREQLLTDGVLMRELKSFPGINAVFCDGEDPDGNVFQLHEKLR